MKPDCGSGDPTERANLLPVKPQVNRAMVPMPRSSLPYPDRGQRSFLRHFRKSSTLPPLSPQEILTSCYDGLTLCQHLARSCPVLYLASNSVLSPPPPHPPQHWPAVGDWERA